MSQLSDIELLQIADLFQLDSKAEKVCPYGEGHINRTFCIKTASRRYILQKINNQIFKDVDGLMENIVAVTDFLRAKDSNPRHVQTVVYKRDGKSFYEAEKNSYWRVYEFIEDSICLQLPESDYDFYSSALAFGHFQQELKDFPAATLHETIPNFHNTVKRYQDFKEVLARDPMGRAAACRAEIDEVLSREEDGAWLIRKLEQGDLPLKVTHNDTKLNNVMLDAATRKPLCVIDLDTIMPGLAAYDFGDSIRFGASTAAEDEEDLSKVRFNIDRFKAFSRGYLEACPGLTPVERDSLVWGSKIMTLECGLRFLADYLDGDHYFAVSKPNHNLLRARTQLKLVSEMEKVWDSLFDVIQSL